MNKSIKLLFIMKPNHINAKSIARIAAVQTLYQYKMEGCQQTLDSIMQQMIRFYQDERIKNASDNDNPTPVKIKLSIGYFETLVKAVDINMVEIDQIIINHLISKWKINTLPILLLALLRVAVCELKFFPDTPDKVVINEFTDITSDMLSEHEVGFVNSILDVISKI